MNLTNIGFGLGLDPTRLKATAGITVADLLSLQGTLIAAFPTADHPFVLARDEVGPDFPADLYGQKFTEPTIGAAADLGVKLPVVGTVSLGSGYLLYEIPDFIALGGREEVNIAKVLEFGGSISAAANFRDGTLNLNGEEHACLLVIAKLCAKAVVNVSRGPHAAGGAGGCIDVGGFHVGGGIQWKHPFDPIIWPLDGCKWSRFKVDVHPTAAAANRRTIVVRRGQLSPVLKIFGRRRRANRPGDRTRRPVARRYRRVRLQPRRQDPGSALRGPDRGLHGDRARARAAGPVHRHRDARIGAVHRESRARPTSPMHGRPDT